MLSKQRRRGSSLGDAVETSSTRARRRGNSSAVLGWTELSQGNRMGEEDGIFFFKNLHWLLMKGVGEGESGLELLIVLKEEAVVF